MPHAASPSRPPGLWAASRWIDTQERPQPAESFIEVLELVQGMRVPGEVLFPALVVGGHTDRQGALVAQVRASRVEGSATHEYQVLESRDLHGDRVGVRVPALHIGPLEQDVERLSGAGWPRESLASQILAAGPAPEPAVLR